MGEEVLDIGGDHRLAHQVDVVQLIDQAHEVVDVHQSRGAVGLALVLKGGDGRAGGTEVHALAAGPDVIVRRAAAAGIDHIFTASTGDNVFHQGAGKAEPAVFVQVRALGKRDLVQLVGGIADAESLQEVERPLVNALDVGGG